MASCFFGSWFCLAIAQKINNEPENKKPRNQKNKKNKKPKNKKNNKIGKKTRLHTPRGGVVAESWVLSFFQMVFCGFLSFFGSWFCLAIAQKISNEPETKKPKKQKKTRNQKTKSEKKQDCTPQGGSSGRELGLVIFFKPFFFYGFLFFLDLGFV